MMPGCTHRNMAVPVLCVLMLLFPDGVVHTVLDCVQYIVLLVMLEGVLILRILYFNKLSCETFYFLQ